MFQSNLQEAQSLLSNYLPKTASYYRNNRNYTYDEENKSLTTSLLSPYIRYRLLSEENIIKKTLAIHPYIKVEKFIQEIYWRTYWKGWLEHRREVYSDYLNQKNSLSYQYINHELYNRAINGKTKLDFFNEWTYQLKDTGYLHNHIRMWFASIWIFTLKLPWQLGANFFMENLLDGDPASNTLSWRWVGGIQTKGKNYLARKDNITKYANINIKKDIELNSHESSLTEEKIYNIKDIKFINTDDYNLNSIVIPSDELNFLIDTKFKIKNIFSGVPIKDYNDHKFSSKIINHIKKIMNSNFDDSEFYKDYNYEIHFENYYNSFKDWVKKNKINDVGIPYVTKGNWNKIYKKLISENPSINFVYLYRKYDMNAWKFSKKGFFNFKKNIPELISKL